MKLSIITYVFASESNNRLPLLKRAIESVKKQQIESYEHIIIDDGSTIDIFKALSFESEPYIRYIRKPNTGITLSTETYNKGFKEALGDYLIILSSDDEYVENSLHHFVEHLDTCDDVAVVGQANYIDESGTIKPFLPHWNNAAEDLLNRGNFINGCAIMFRRTLLSLGMKFPPNITSFCADYDMWVRVSEFGKIGRLEKEIVNYYNHADATRKKTRSFIPARGLSNYSIGKHYPFRKPARLRYVKTSAMIRRLDHNLTDGMGSHLVINHVFSDPRVDSVLPNIGSSNFTTIETETGVVYFTKTSDIDADLRSEPLSSFVPEHELEALLAHKTIHIIGCRANAAFFTRTLPPGTNIVLYYAPNDINLRWIQEIDWANVSAIVFQSYIEKKHIQGILGLSESTLFIVQEI